MIKVKWTLQHCMQSSSEAKSLRAKCQYLIKIWRRLAGAGWAGIPGAEISGALEREGDRLAFRTVVLISVNLIVNKDYWRTQQRKLPQWKGLETLLQPGPCHFYLMHLLPSVVLFNVFENSISISNILENSYFKVI